MPKHVAIIMDGNGRWAYDNHCKYRWDGHRYGINAVRDVIKAAVEKNIDTLTLFAFSKENHQRSQAEVTALIKLFKECLIRETDELAEHGVKLNFVGDLKGLSPDLVVLARDAEIKTQQCTKLRLNLAINYSGRWQILNAIKHIVSGCQKGIFDIEQLDEATISAVMDKDFGSEPDLMIRTGGEYRISNFILWQLAYSELYFDPKLWPDYNKYDFFEAMKHYVKRQRRFGLESAYAKPV